MRLIGRECKRRKALSGAVLICRGLDLKVRRLASSFFCLVLKAQGFQRSGGDSWGVPPVPIPNTVVKPLYVESTWLEAAWEDRALPVKRPASYDAGLFLSVLL